MVIYISPGSTESLMVSGAVNNPNPNPRRAKTHLIAGRPVRMVGVAVTRLAAVAARHVPGVGRALIAVLTNHVWQAVTLAAAAVTVTVIR